MDDSKMKEIKDEEMSCEGDTESSEEEEEHEEEEMEEDNESKNGEEEGEAKEKVYLPGQKLEKGEKLVVDKSAYKLLHEAQTSAPCLSFDILRDNLGEGREDFPLSVSFVAGTQAVQTHCNQLLVVQMSNLMGTKEHDSDDSESSDDEDEEDEGKAPIMKVSCIKHQGCVNRVRSTKFGNITLAASWSELGTVNIWNLNKDLEYFSSPSSNILRKPSAAKRCVKTESETKPIFKFKGHLCEGYAMDWCPTEPGVLATGDCKGNIHLWKPNESSADWVVNLRSYSSHAPHSVEDIQWSPNEKNVFASCSVDKSIKIWDARVSPKTACMLTASDAHSMDVNVISWNKVEPRFLVSGGDDGLIRIWDLRQFGPGKPTPVAEFKQHTAPVTTVEWHPQEQTVFASGGEDELIAQWDIALEADETEKEESEEITNLPSQLLFIHQGQNEVKELHWHPQCPGVMVSTAHNGFNVFRTISV